jgi:hypothetical protein
MNAFHGRLFALKVQIGYGHSSAAALEPLGHANEYRAPLCNFIQLHFSMLGQTQPRITQQPDLSQWVSYRPIPLCDGPAVVSIKVIFCDLAAVPAVEALRREVR